MSETFVLALKDEFAQIQREAHRIVEKGHGRLEIRKYWTITWFLCSLAATAQMKEVS